MFYHLYNNNAITMVQWHLPVNLPHFLTDLLFLVQWVEIGHFTRIQQVIDVFQEGLLLDLSAEND